MKGFLNLQQIQYVLFHLGQHVDLNNEIKGSFVFLESAEKITGYKNKIIFLLSDKGLNLTEVKWIRNIPVLFPHFHEEEFYYKSESNIVFNEDLLKSAFYLLSGFQEIDNGTLDSLKRFAYESSVQSKLNIIKKPVVNYYFEEIIRGIEEFCDMRGTRIARRNLHNKFTFFLTHDIDRIKYYNLNTLIYTIKLLFGLSQSEKKKYFLIKELFRIGIKMINIFDTEDPYWNFNTLCEKEKKMGIRSTYFFLPKDQKHVDAYYSFKDRKIRTLMKFLVDEGHEIGLHGTVRSHNSPEALNHNINEFCSSSGQNRTGIRQHRLMWQHPATAINHEKAGIAYDSTLGFAAHEGFRNSYCHPFRLFDFDNNRMLSYWEIPLTVMDSTLFYNRKLTTEEANFSVRDLLMEIIRFNGIFTLLWHNSYLNEDDVPGINMFYDNLLKFVVAENPEISTGFEIIEKLDEVKRHEIFSE
jgi:hypothetical protein